MMCFGGRLKSSRPMIQGLLQSARDAGPQQHPDHPLRFNPQCIQNRRILKEGPFFETLNPKIQVLSLAPLLFPFQY